VVVTTQVPVREIFLTSGPSRKLRLGQQDVEFKHGMLWQLLMGIVLQAWPFAPWRGWGQSKPLRRSKSCIPSCPRQWEAMRAARAAMPSWMARAASEVASV
jgi:hypothetical protein